MKLTFESFTVNRHVYIAIFIMRIWTDRDRDHFRKAVSNISVKHFMDGKAVDKFYLNFDLLIYAQLVPEVLLVSRTRGGLSQRIVGQT